MWLDRTSIGAVHSWEGQVPEAERDAGFRRFIAVNEAPTTIGASNVFQVRSSSWLPSMSSGAGYGVTVMAALLNAAHESYTRGSLTASEGCPGPLSSEVERVRCRGLVLSRKASNPVPWNWHNSWVMT